MNLPEIWSVITYSNDEVHAEEGRWLFSCLHDVHSSIHITWHKIMDTIKITCDLDKRTIHVHDVDSNRVLLDCHRMESRDVCDGPTHF